MNLVALLEAAGCPGPLTAMDVLCFALEEVIDEAEAGLLKDGLLADRDSIRERILHPDNRYLLLP
jgi:hypothetical protein